MRALPSRSRTPSDSVSMSDQHPEPSIHTGALTKTSPLAELLAVGDLDQGDLVLGAKGDDQLLVGLLLAGLVQDTHVSLATVEGLGSLAETAGKTIVHESELQNTLQRVQDGHLALGGGIAGNLDLVGHVGHGGGVVLFYVGLNSKRARVSEVFPTDGRLAV